MEKRDHKKSADDAKLKQLTKQVKELYEELLSVIRKKNALAARCAKQTLMAVLLTTAALPPHGFRFFNPSVLNAQNAAVKKYGPRIEARDRARKAKKKYFRATTRPNSRSDFRER